MKLVIDASVAVKLFVKETGTDRARTAASNSDATVAPDIVIPEVMNAAWKLMRQGIVPPDQFEDIASALPKVFVELVPAASLVARAAAICRRLDHPIYDCFYVALAEARDCELITADRRLLQRLQGSAWGARARDLYDLPAA